MPDPAAVEGTEAEKRLAFADACRMLNNRISIFTSLPLANLDRHDAAEASRRDWRAPRDDRAGADVTEQLPPSEFDLPRRLAAEALGTALLVATVVGSGIMADG